MAGPFYFAWVDASETTFAAAHKRNDENVFSMVMSQAEGDFASLQVDIINPRVGLLIPSRKQWVWLSYDDDGSPDAIPLFFGRIVGIPQDLQNNVIRLLFMARPADYEAQKDALAETLRVSPFWDDIWFDEFGRENADNVLNARPELWHVDRVTHEVTTSNIITGEDGTFVPVDTLYDSVTVRIGQTPVRRVKIDAELFWDQSAIGEVDITQDIISEFQSTGTTAPGRISSITGEGLQNDWPKEGDRIGGDWEVGETSISRSDGSVNTQFFISTIFSSFFSNRTVLSQFLGGATTAQFPVWTFNIDFNVRFDTSRSRKETVSFELTADVQALLTDAGEDDFIEAQFSTSDVGEPIDIGEGDTAGAAAPIGDVRRRQYLTTDRGIQSLEYLISFARAQMLNRARAVDVDFQVPFEEGLYLSCRMNASVSEPRLPGGAAAGKIKSYTLAVDGNTGEKTATITIGATIGRGSSVVETAGTPDYVVLDYVADAYQTFSGKTVLLPTAGDVTFEDFSGVEPVDDGVDFFNMRPRDILLGVTVEGGIDDHTAIMNASIGPHGPGSQEFLSPTVIDNSNIGEEINKVFTEVCVNLKPLNTGPFETPYDITVSDLSIPKTIDLETP